MLSNKINGFNFISILSNKIIRFHLILINDVLDIASFLLS